MMSSSDDPTLANPMSRWRLALALLSAACFLSACVILMGLKIAYDLGVAPWSDPIWLRWATIFVLSLGGSIAAYQKTY